MATKKKAPKPTRTIKPGEQHPGQTAEHGYSHDRMGSQLEMERHRYPNGNIPKAGSARSNKQPRAKGGGAQRKAAK